MSVPTTRPPASAATAWPSTPPEPPPSGVPDRLKGVAGRGMRWAAAAHGLKLAAHLGATLVYAALLEQADFGAFGFAAAALALAQLLRDPATGQAVVRGGVDEAGQASLFWLNAGLGALAAVLFWLGGEALARWLAAPGAAGRGSALDGLLLVLAPALFAGGVAVVPQARLQAALRSRTLAILEMVAVTTGVVVGLVVAWAGGGALALGAQVAVAQVVLAAGVCAAARWWPRPSLRWSALRAVAGFSLPLAGHQVLHWSTRNLDHVLVFAVLGEVALGAYALTTRLLLQPLLAVGQVVQRVLFPVLARIRDDAPRSRNATLKTSAAVALLLVPVFAGAATVAEPLVLAVLGERWLGVVPLLPWIAVVGVAQSLCTPMGCVYQARGRTDLLLGWGIVTALGTAIGFSVGLALGGVEGVAIGYTLVSIALLAPGLAIPLRLVEAGVRDFVAAVWPVLAAAGLMVAAVLAVDALLAHAWAPGVRLAALVITGAVVYVVGSLALHGAPAAEVWRMATRGDAP